MPFPPKVNNIVIRSENPDDFTQVRMINEQAFGQHVEADLVDKLRRSCPDTLSLVAEDSGRILGHILFTPVVIESSGYKVHGMGLAPMAVLPECQRKGVGSLLVNKGLDILRDRGYPYVIVLGHPEYYPRFGFEPASKYSIKSQWDGVPDEAFMIAIFDHKAMHKVEGVARYREEFNKAM